jgi:hypothetical protein
VALGAFVAGAAAMVIAAPFLFLWLGVRGGLASAGAVLVLPALIAALSCGVRFADVMGPARPSAKQWALTAGLSVALWLVAGGVLELQQLVLPFPPELLAAFRRLHAALRPEGPIDAVVAVAAIALAPALAEETLVRGLLLPSLARSLKSGSAIALSAAAFALLHTDGHRWPFTFVLGLALGWLRLHGKTLALPLLVHGLFNTITFLVAPFVDEGTNTAHPEMGVVLLVLGLALGWPLWKSLERGLAPDAPTPRQRSG